VLNGAPAKREGAAGASKPRGIACAGVAWPDRSPYHLFAGRVPVRPESGRWGPRCPRVTNGSVRNRAAKVYATSALWWPPAASSVAPHWPSSATLTHIPLHDRVNRGKYRLRTKP
jgi:hypothetical protein